MVQEEGKGVKASYLNVSQIIGPLELCKLIFIYRLLVGMLGLRV